MRRGNRQKLIGGDEQDWCHHWARRAYRLTRKPGLGKYNKRNMARRRRRDARRDANKDGEEETLVTLSPFRKGFATTNGHAPLSIYRHFALAQRS